MNWDAISAIAEMLAALGVIATLMFVGIQIRRDHRARMIETSYQRQMGSRDIFLALATVQHLAPIAVKTTDSGLLPPAAHLQQALGLTAEEAVRWNAFWVTMVRQAEGSLGTPILDEERREVERVLVTGLIAGRMSD